MDRGLPVHRADEVLEDVEDQLELRPLYLVHGHLHPGLESNRWGQGVWPQGWPNWWEEGPDRATGELRRRVGWDDPGTEWRGTTPHTCPNCPRGRTPPRPAPRTPRRPSRDSYRSPTGVATGRPRRPDPPTLGHRPSPQSRVDHSRGVDREVPPQPWEWKGRTQRARSDRVGGRDDPTSSTPEGGWGLTRVPGNRVGDWTFLYLLRSSPLPRGSDATASLLYPWTPQGAGPPEGLSTHVKEGEDGSFVRVPVSWVSYLSGPASRTVPTGSDTETTIVTSTEGLFSLVPVRPLRRPCSGSEVRRNGIEDKAPVPPGGSPVTRLYSRRTGPDVSTPGTPVLSWSPPDVGDPPLEPPCRGRPRPPWSTPVTTRSAPNRVGRRTYARRARTMSPTRPPPVRRPWDPTRPP